MTKLQFSCLKDEYFNKIFMRYKKRYQEADSVLMVFFQMIFD